MKRIQLKEIAKRAALVKSNPNLRHEPNDKDLLISSEHARLMSYPQYQTIKEDKECQP
jgi:hypothetical protein